MSRNSTAARLLTILLGAPGVASAAGVDVGVPVRIDNLAVFPLLGDSRPELAGIITLEQALDAGTAKVRELGVEATPPSPHRVRFCRLGRRYRCGRRIASRTTEPR